MKYIRYIKGKSGFLEIELKIIRNAHKERNAFTTEINKNSSNFLGDMEACSPGIINNFFRLMPNGQLTLQVSRQQLFERHARVFVVLRDGRRASHRHHHETVLLKLFIAHLQTPLQTRLDIPKYLALKRIGHHMNTVLARAKLSVHVQQLPGRSIQHSRRGSGFARFTFPMV